MKSLVYKYQIELFKSMKRKEIKEEEKKMQQYVMVDCNNLY